MPAALEFILVHGATPEFVAPYMPREAVKLLGLVAAQGLCGLEVVEVSPPYDTSDITALVGVRVVVETLGAMAAHGKLGSHKHLIDKPATY
jgi:agmatinase